MKVSNHTKSVHAALVVTSRLSLLGVWPESLSRPPCALSVGATKHIGSTDTLYRRQEAFGPFQVWQDQPASEPWYPNNQAERSRSWIRVPPNL